MPSLWCLCDSVQVRTRCNNFFFCVQLIKNVTGEETFKKVDSFFKEYQLSWIDSVSVYADGAPSMMETKKDLMSFFEKGKQRHFSYSLSSCHQL